MDASKPHLLWAALATGMAMHSLCGCFIILIRRVIRGTGFNGLFLTAVSAWLLLVVSIALQIALIYIQFFTPNLPVKNPKSIYALSVIKAWIDCISASVVLVVMYLRIQPWNNPRGIMVMDFIKKVVLTLLVFLIAGYVLTIWASFLLNNPETPYEQFDNLLKILYPISIIRGVALMLYVALCTGYFLFIVSRGVGTGLKIVFTETIYRHGGATLFASFLLNLFQVLIEFDRIPGLGTESDFTNICLYTPPVTFALDLHAFLSVSYEVAKQLIQDSHTSNSDLNSSQKRLVDKKFMSQDTSHITSEPTSTIHLPLGPSGPGGDMGVQALPQEQGNPTVPEKSHYASLTYTSERQSDTSRLFNESASHAYNDPQKAFETESYYSHEGQNLYPNNKQSSLRSLKVDTALARSGVPHAERSSEGQTLYSESIHPSVLSPSVYSHSYERDFGGSDPSFIQPPRPSPRSPYYSMAPSLSTVMEQDEESESQQNSYPGQSSIAKTPQDAGSVDNTTLGKSISTFGSMSIFSHAQGPTNMLNIDRNSTASTVISTGRQGGPSTENSGHLVPPSARASGSSYGGVSPGGIRSPRPGGFRAKVPDNVAEETFQSNGSRRPSAIDLFSEQNGPGSSLQT